MFRRVPLGGGGGGRNGGVIGMSLVQSVLLKDRGLSVSTLNNCARSLGGPLMDGKLQLMNVKIGALHYVHLQI